MWDKKNTRPHDYSIYIENLSIHVNQYSVFIRGLFKKYWTVGQQKYNYSF